MFQKIWGSQQDTGSSPSAPRMKSKQVEVEEIKNDQVHNPYTELQVLKHHEDIVRHLISIDDDRLISAGDDGQAVIWDIKTGRKILVLTGHTRPITCLLVLKPLVDSSISMYNSCIYLLTAASDRQMKVWDVNSGECIRTISEHVGYVKCLISLSNGELVCSGGEKLCLWDRKGNLLHKYERKEDKQESIPADIHLLIVLKNDRIVAASERHLVVYSVNTVINLEDGGENRQEIEFLKKLPPHREPIRCLINLTEITFASGSLDGTIIVWTTHSLSPSRYFNSVGEYEGTFHCYPYSIQHMVSVDERYVLAAVGSGFCVYDIAGKQLARKTGAHYSKIVHLDFVYNGRFLATCSEDGSIRLWGCHKNLEQKNQTRKNVAETDRIEWLFGMSKDALRQQTETNTLLEPDLLGECLGHSGTVQKLIDLGEAGIGTCGMDGLVILWRDGIVQTMRRMETAREMLAMR